MNKIENKFRKFSIHSLIYIIFLFSLSCGNRDNHIITQQESDIYHCRLKTYFSEDKSDRGLVLNINTTLPDQIFLHEFISQKVFSDILGDNQAQIMIEKLLLMNQKSCKVEGNFSVSMEHLILFSTEDYYSLFGDSLTESLPPPIKSFSRIAFSSNHEYALFYEDIVEHLGLGGEGVLLLLRKSDAGVNNKNDACTEWKIIDEYHIWIS